MFRFRIRDVLWLTVVVALAVGWVLDRQALSTRAIESDSWQALAESLTKQLDIKQPAASIEIIVNGRSVATSSSFAAPCIGSIIISVIGSILLVLIMQSCRM